MSDERLQSVPSGNAATDSQTETGAAQEAAVETKITKEESERSERVLFEDDDSVTLRDGMSYKLPPFGLKDGRIAVKMLNAINSNVIVDNMIADPDGNDRYDTLMEVLYMAFKPYHKEVTKEYLEEYVDVLIAKKIIDIIIGLNGIKKLM